MVNAQEWLDQNLSKDWSKITHLSVGGKNLEGALDLTRFSNLRSLDCGYNQLTSAEFLKTLPNPDKLEVLEVFSNNIPPTDIAIFSSFSNLKVLKIGTTKGALKEGRHNKFYGSFKSWKNLTKLISICIEATDVDSGLEYLPDSLVRAIWGGGWKYFKIECSPHLEYLPSNTPQPKCKAIQDQLRPFDYDLSTWQLANFDLMLKTDPLSLWKLYPHIFTEKDQKEKLFSNLIIKIEEVQQEIGLVKASENQKTCSLRKQTNPITKNGYWTKSRNHPVRRRTPSRQGRVWKGFGKIPRMARKATERNHWAERRKNN